MADAMYMTDSYLKEFDAVVSSVKDGKYVVLDRTAFYPNGGGQPTDFGTMKRESDGREFKVVFVGKFDGQISHEVSEQGLQQGDNVHCNIDWERRYKLMRAHTAAHLLCTIINAESGALITGNQLDIEKSRIDFNLENFDREKINEYIAKANEKILQNFPVKVYFLPRDEAMKIPGIVKLACALPPEVSELRIVEIESVDIQADGGTHVKSLKEIGKIELVSIDNKGKNNRRIYYKVVD